MSTQHRTGAADATADPFADHTATAATRGARAGRVATAGRPAAAAPQPPAPPQWQEHPEPFSTDVDDEDTPDYSSLETVNRDLLRLRVRMGRIRREMARAGRDAVTAKLAYQRAMRRALIQQSGGTAEMRRAHAELACEELETRWVTAQQIADEYNTLFRAARDDAENAKTVAFNLRSLVAAAH